MKKLLTFLLLLPLLAPGQNFTFTPLSGFYARNGVGNDQWQEQSGNQIVSGYLNPTVYYRRFTVADLVNPDGSITFTKFDSKLNAAIEGHMTFGFRIFTMYAWPCGVDCFNKNPQLTGVDYRTGNTVTTFSACPQEWFSAMQAGPAPRPWVSESGDWVPAYNSSAFLTRLVALHEAINTHIMTGSYIPSWNSGVAVPYKNAIEYIDVSGFGTWGEWHSYASCFNNVVTTYPGYGLTGSNDQVAGSSFPTIATMKAIIDAHKNAYDSFQLCIIINAFDAMRLPNTRIPAEVGVYAYQTRTASGRWMGRRIDHAGDDTGYDDFYLQDNPGSFGGYRMDTASNYRHRLAPFRGEPPGGPVYYNGVVQGLLPIQARKWHLASIGNGNYGDGNTPTGAGADSVRLAYSIMGYHYRLTGGNYTLTSSNFTVNLNWQNFGLTPTYDHYIVEYSLRNGAGATVWTGNSTFDPYLYSTEQGNTTKTDVFARPALPAGTFTLWVRAKDRLNYRVPMQLQINGRDGNGYYPMGNVVFTTTGNQSPTVNAGGNQSISGTSTTLTAVASDVDGTIASYQWSLQTGPSAPVFGSPTAASTTVSSLVAGTYTFNVTVTDNLGATGSDQVNVTVNNPVPPVANAGPNQSITLPTNSTTLNGSGTDADGTIVRYAWTQVAGPSSATIASPLTASTGVSNLVAGTYSFRLTVTDNSDRTGTDDVNVLVNPGNAAPVANAGANQTITLPTSSVNLSGSASTDDIGITAYLWTQVGGPAGPTITTPTTVNTSVTGLTAGIFIFRLRVTDAGGLTHTDDVQVTVNAAPNGTPVANAGANQIITLPTSSVTVSSAGSTDDVGITSRLWTKVSGPASFTIVTPTAISTSITGLVAGVYSFRVTVQDAGGLSAFDDVQITVNAAANVAPVSNAGGNQTIQLPTNSTSLSGSASSDDVAIVTYGWSKLSGPVGGFIATPSSVTTNITGLTAGTYTYRLRVVDGGGLADDDDVQIVVLPAVNAAPVANAGTNILLTLPTNSTTLNGSGSTDDAAIASYAWTKISGPASYTLATPGAVSTSLTGLVAGVYTFRLTVTDAAGLTGTDDVQVTVNNTTSDYKWWQFWRWFFKNR